MAHFSNIIADDTNKDTNSTQKNPLEPATTGFGDVQRQLAFANTQPPLDIP
jgi:hypothetical protein